VCLTQTMGAKESFPEAVILKQIRGIGRVGGWGCRGKGLEPEGIWPAEK
jgi:hypothetical protein